MKTPWAPLADNQAFKALYDAENSPLKAIMDQLQRKALSLDPNLSATERMREVATLYGIQLVRRVVEESARAEDEAPEQQQPQSTTERWASLAKSALPRRIR